MNLLARFGQHRAAHRGDSGYERFEQVVERDCAVGLGGDERAIDDGQRDASEPDGHGAVGVVAECDRDLLAQPVQSETNSSWPTWSFSPPAGMLIGQPPYLGASGQLRVDRRGQRREAAKLRVAIRPAGSQPPRVRPDRGGRGDGHVGQSVDKRRVRARKRQEVLED